MTLRKTGFTQQWLLHTLFWMAAIHGLDMFSYSYHTLYKSTPETLIRELPNFWERFRDGTYWIVLTFTLLVELTYQKAFLTRKPVFFLLVSILSGGIFALFTYLTYNFLDTNPQPEKVAPYFITYLAYLWIYTLCRRYLTKELEKTEQRYQHSQAELQNLKAQLNPHFFFNTLNNLYGTALEENAPRTAALIDQLSGMMRYVLTGTQIDKTLISNELKFIQDYLDLQKIRLPKRDSIQILSRISYDQAPATIAPLLLIPFIENAFTYGISMQHPSVIDLALEINDSTLRLVIKNRKHPASEDRKSFGSGISNTRRRLDLMYPSRHTLLVNEDTNNYLVDLWIDLR